MSVLWVESQSYEGLGGISVVELAVEVIAILGSGALWCAVSQRVRSLL